MSVLPREREARKPTVPGNVSVSTTYRPVVAGAATVTPLPVFGAASSYQPVQETEGVVSSTLGTVAHLGKRK